LINPQILEEGKNSLSEECVSLPEIFVRVNRAKKIKVEGLNDEGKLIKLRVEDFLARVIQHGIDHLNGTLIIDYATEIRKEKIEDNLGKIANHTRMIFEVKNRRK